MEGNKAPELSWVDGEPTIDFFMNTHATHVVDDASNNLRPVECSVSQASRNSTREYQNNKPSNSTRIAYPIAKVGQSGFIINLAMPMCVYAFDIIQSWLLPPPPPLHPSRQLHSNSRTFSQFLSDDDDDRIPT